MLITKKFKFFYGNKYSHSMLNLNFFSSNFNKIQIKYFSGRVKVDPYFVLDLHRGAEFREIKKAYFKLARQYHPDLNKNDEVKQYIIYLFTYLLINTI